MGLDKEAVLRILSQNLGMIGACILLGNNEAFLIKQMLEDGIISPEEVKKALHEGLLWFGYRMCEQHMRIGIAPDHLRSPQALGYAIKHGWVNSDTASRIRFDHGETLEKYEAYADGLPERLFEQIIAGPADVCPSSLGTIGDDYFGCH